MRARWDSRSAGTCRSDRETAGSKWRLPGRKSPSPCNQRLPGTRSGSTAGSGCSPAMRKPPMPNSRRRAPTWTRCCTSVPGYPRCSPSGTRKATPCTSCRPDRQEFVRAARSGEAARRRGVDAARRASPRGASGTGSLLAVLGLRRVIGPTRGGTPDRHRRVLGCDKRVALRRDLAGQLPILLTVAVFDRHPELVGATVGPLFGQPLVKGLPGLFLRGGRPEPFAVRPVGTLDDGFGRLSPVLVRVHVRIGVPRWQVPADALLHCRLLSLLASRSRRGSSDNPLDNPSPIASR